MKNFLTLLRTILLAAACYPAITMAQVSGTAAAERPDFRIDNLSYWMKMAEKGVIPYNPQISIPPAIYKSSRISAHGIKTMNSTDIPICTLSNVTESENSVFVDPDNADYILNSDNSTYWDGSSSGTVYGTDYFMSANAGIGWVGSPQGAGGTNSGDPTTAIGLNGRRYINYISSSYGQGISFSDDGTSWTKATVGPNPGDIADKNHMWIDNKITSPHMGNIYVAWTDFGGPDDGQIRFSRSVNSGVTWSTPLTLSTAIYAGSHNQGVNIQTGPNGDVYAVWAVYDANASDESAIGFAKSIDGGVSFQPAIRIITNIKGIRQTGVLKNQRANSFPVMAVDISNGPDQGKIYVVWTNTGTPGINTGTNKSIYMIRSVNGGSTWSSPIRVNQGAFLAGKEAYFPWVSCDTETGVLSAVFYDDRNVSGTQVETFVAWSDDAGTTWSDFPVSDVAFTPVAIPGLATGYMGDYLGITSKGGKVYPCWTGNRNGHYLTYVSPLEIGLNARFSTPTTTVCTDQAVTFNNNSTGSPTICAWSFPGGMPSSFSGLTPPPVTYPVPGVYDVSLTISDGSSTDTETKSGYITVKTAIAAFTGTPTTVSAGNFVTFTNESLCNPVSWKWSFPGGVPSTFIGQNPPHITYSATGNYDVSLSIANANGVDTLVNSGYISVVPAVYNMTNGTVTTCAGMFYDSGGPSGNYQDNETYVETFYPTTPAAMMRFVFSSFSTELNRDTLTIYNGASASAPVIGKYHGATSPGTVTATNPSGALTVRFHSDGSITKTGWVAAISCYTSTIPPVANFSASTVTPITGQTVTFTDLTTNLPATWAWSFTPSTVTFVNGTTAVSQNPQVQFTASGTYSVTLSAANAYGTSILTKTNYITATNCTISAFPWSEGFEGQTTLPACWSQEQVSSSGISWSILTGNGTGYPAAAHGGTHDACLKDNSSADNKTRLITPTFNLSSLTNPQLKFWHTQAAWYSSQDVLTVFYRTSATGSWIQLATYTASIPAWTLETINLPAGSATYAIAFEGNAKWGRGVCIDDIQVVEYCPVYLPVSVAVSASANPVDEDIPVTFTATATNGGSAPVYQWRVNSVNAGTYAATFSYMPANGDSVQCRVTSGLYCVTGNPATSDAVVMTVNSAPPVIALENVTIPGNQCFHASQIITLAGGGTTFSVQEFGSVTLTAGQKVSFYPGTTVVSGGYLHAYIATQGPYCPGPLKPVTALKTGSPVARLPQFRIKVFPNPATEFFRLEVKGYSGKMVTVEVYNMQGGLVIRQESATSGHPEYSLKGLPSGIYLVRVSGENQSESVRLVRE